MDWRLWRRRKETSGKFQNPGKGAGTGEPGRRGVLLANQRAFLVISDGQGKARKGNTARSSSPVGPESFGWAGVGWEVVDRGSGRFGCSACGGKSRFIGETWVWVLSMRGLGCTKCGWVGSLHLHWPSAGIWPSGLFRR